MSWFGKLLGTDKALDIASKVTTGIINGIDKSCYTEHEKATDTKKVLLALQDQFTPRSISRRLLAFFFCISYCCSFIVALVFACLDRTVVVNNIINLVNAFELGWIVITIVIFYFGNYIVDKLKK
ncbi:MAG: hypothetical protein ACTSP4_00460 [Candidatus Hodarchaeales archaeon]